MSEEPIRPLTHEEREEWLKAMEGVTLLHWALHCATNRIESPVRRIQRYEATIQKLEKEARAS